MRHLVFGALLGALLLGAGISSRADPSTAREAVRKLQPKINQAIDRGVMRLLLLQQRDGSWGFREKQYQGGMTALALYALLRSGVPPDHPAIQRGISRLYAWDPQETYSVACELLALEATQDPRHRKRMERLLARLLAWQRFGWGYPYGHEGEGVWNRRMGRNDLSNTQFAVMGIRAALHSGLEVPPKVFQEIVRETRFHQHRPEKRSVRDAYGKPVEMAGFGYKGPSTNGGLSKPTGSMTCAGIAVLTICRDALGSKIRSKLARQIDESVRLALAWLDGTWSVESNPNDEKAHKQYYLYGLERVGSLLGTETVGEHAWYLEGAQEFLKIQKDDGGFGGDAETCFALLFLVRATGQGTGKPLLQSVLGRYAVDEAESPVRFRAEGHSPLTLWITSVEGVQARRGAHRSGQGLEILRVEYLVDGEIVATHAGEVGGAPRDETFRVQHHFPGPGDYEIQARVHLREQGGESQYGTEIVQSLPLTVKVKLLWPPWALRAAQWTVRDVMPRPVAVEATSTNAKHQQPERAIDGVTDGFWIADPGDLRPTIHVKLPKAVKANTIVLHPLATKEDQRGTFDRTTRVEVLVNGKGPHVVAADPDSLRPTAVRLPTVERIKRLEIRIVERLPGSRWHGQVGFSEISLELDPVAPPTLVRGDDGLVTLDCETAEARIHYTLDGTTPTTDDLVYETPFSYVPAGRLHAVAVLPTGATSRLLVADLRACDGRLQLDRSRWTILRVDSEQLPAHPIALAFDGDPRTFWHTRHDPTRDPPPHEIVIDLGESLVIEGFTYRARHEGTHGNVRDWTFYVSETPHDWGPFVGQGAFENVRRLQAGKLIGPVKGRYVRFVARSEMHGQPHASCAEFDVQARRP